MMSNKRAFTLIELLLVIVIVAILAGIVLIAVNPGRQVAQANNAQRTSNINAILSAVHQYGIDNRGSTPSVISTTPTLLGSASGSIDVCVEIVPRYIAGMPFDPTVTGAHFTDCGDYATGYMISRDSSNRITVAAPSAELDTTLSVTR